MNLFSAKRTDVPSNTTKKVKQKNKLTPVTVLHRTSQYSLHCHCPVLLNCALPVFTIALNNIPQSFYVVLCYLDTEGLQEQKLHIKINSKLFRTALKISTFAKVQMHTSYQQYP